MECSRSSMGEQNQREENRLSGQYRRIGSTGTSGGDCLERKFEKGQSSAPGADGDILRAKMILPDMVPGHGLAHLVVYRIWSYFLFGEQYS